MTAKQAGAQQGRSRNWVKHIARIVIWWLSLGYVIQHNSGMTGLAFLTVFFLLSSWKKLGKIVILAVVVGLLCSLFPILEIPAGIFAVIGIALKFKFLLRNWRPLVVGLYTYGIYAFVLIMTKTVGLIAYLASSRAAEAFASSGQIDASVPFYIQLLPYIVTGVLAFFLHRMVLWLYRHDYDTDTAFGIMGITPLIAVGFLLPFLKGLDTDIDVDLSDFDADDIADSISDGLGDLLPDTDTPDADDLGDLLPDTSPADIDADAADADSTSFRDLVDTGKAVTGTLSDTFGDDLPDGFDNVDTFFTDLQSMQHTGDTVLSSLQSLGDAQDLGEAFWSSVDSIPAPVQAGMAVAAAAAAHKLDNEEMVFRISGLGKLKTRQIDDTHAVLLGAGDCKFGEIVFDPRNNCERIKLENGMLYIINYNTGKIRDGVGHTLGYVKKDDGGMLALTNSKQQPLGTYLPNGTFYNPVHQMTARLETT